MEERHEPIGLIVADSDEVEFPLIGRVTASGRDVRVGVVLGDMEMGGEGVEIRRPDGSRECDGGSTST